MKRVIYFITLLPLMTVLFACSGGGTTSATPGAPAAPDTPAVGNIVTLHPGIAAKASLTDSATNATLNFSFPANAVNQTTNVTVSPVAPGALPGRLKLAKKTMAFDVYSGNVTNVYAIAFTINAGNVKEFNVAVPLSGTLAPIFKSGTTLNVAIFQSNSWVDVSTVVMGANGAFTQTLVSTELTGITAPGTYVIYKPATGGNTAVSNLGIVLLADDSHGMGTSGGLVHGVQVINLFDVGGAPLPTPTIKYLVYSNATDIDGVAVTPDGSQGILVDGGSSTVRFFSKVHSGLPIASTNTVDISAYGGAGDAVAIMPTGDVAVVSGDSQTQLVVISGVLSGTPVVAGVITIPNNRDGLTISNDGAVLLARGMSGLTVFSITGPAPYTFTQTADIPSLGAANKLQEGRDGMAISPVDSNRSVILGISSGNLPQITIVTGLTTSPAAGTPLTLTGVGDVFSVAITPDGTSAVVGTDSGIVLVSGVDTGTLQQVGTPFAPTFLVAANPVTMTTVPTLGFTLDGKYLVACNSPNIGYGTSYGSLLLIAFDLLTPEKFGAIVGLLNGITIPDSDQMVLH